MPIPSIQKYPEPDVLIVASQAKWVYEDFKKVTLSDNAWNPWVTYSYGMGIPSLDFVDPFYSPKRTVTAQRPAIWTNTAHAARLRRVGFAPPLLAPGPEWLSSAPKHLTRRTVSTRTLGDVRNDLRSMEDESLQWVKLAEMKDDRLPTQRCFIRDFVLKALDYGAPDDAVLQLCPENLCLTTEQRFFILDHKVITGSAYSILGDVYDADKGGFKATEDLKDFAQFTATLMRSRSPRAYTLDVGWHLESNLMDEVPVVIEANPVWSSAIYGSKPDLAMKAIIAGVDYQPNPRFLWNPDPWLVKKAEYQVPLLPE